MKSTKVCIKCKKEKPYEKFWNSRTRTLRKSCSSCNHQKTAKQRAALKRQKKESKLIAGPYVQINHNKPGRYGNRVKRA